MWFVLLSRDCLFMRSMSNHLKTNFPDVNKKRIYIGTEMSRIDDTVIKEKLSQSRSFFKQINMYYSKVNLIISLWKRLQIFYIIELNKLEFDGEILL